MHTTEGQPELRQFLVRKMLLHLSTPAWRPGDCPRPRPVRRGRQSLEALEMVVLIKVKASASGWRHMVRSTLPELTSDIRIGCRVLLRPYFVVGTRGLDLRQEERRYGDLAMLNMTDSFVTSGQNSEKTYKAFAWALERHPLAHLIFHQDGDTLVDWRQALPRLLNRLFPLLPPTLEELQRLQLGRLCERVPSQLLAGCPGAVEAEPCGAGSLYGFSADVVRWMVQTQAPEVGRRMDYEDMHACRWARRFEANVGLLDSCGLLRARDFQNAWIHPLKAPFRCASKPFPILFRAFC